MDHDLLIKEIAKKLDIHEEVVRMSINTYLDRIKRSMLELKPITIRDLIYFDMVVKPPRKGKDGIKNLSMKYYLRPRVNRALKIAIVSKKVKEEHKHLAVSRFAGKVVRNVSLFRRELHSPKEILKGKL